MPREKIVAALDIGSNSVLLLLAKHGEQGELEPINEYVAITRLGENLVNTGELTEEAIERTVAAAREMQQIAMSEGTTSLVVTATSAVRDANNRSLFLVKCHQALDIYPQVLSGKEEATFTFLGATHDIAPHKPVVLMDIGGGSTEFAYGTRERMTKAFSLNLGCVRLTEQFDLNNAGILRQNSAVSHIRRELAVISKEITDWTNGISPTILVSGGTATTYAAIIKKQPIYDRNEIHMTESRRRDVAATFKMLMKLSIQKRHRIPGMEKGRAEVMPAGLLIMATVLKYFNFDEFTVSAAGLRLGLLKHFVGDS